MSIPGPDPKRVCRPEYVRCKSSRSHWLSELVCKSNFPVSVVSLSHYGLLSMLSAPLMYVPVDGRLIPRSESGSGSGARATAETSDVTQGGQCVTSRLSPYRLLFGGFGFVAVLVLVVLRLHSVIVGLTNGRLATPQKVSGP